MPIDVPSFNNNIRARLQHGESLFRIALELDKESIAAIKDYADSLPDYPREARMAAWFADFFNADSQRQRMGHDYLLCSWGTVRGQQKQQIQQCWQSVFVNLGLDSHNFKAHCWAVDCTQGQGRGTNLWHGIDQCLKLDSDQCFSIGNYENPPRCFQLLLESYNQGEATGNDFAEFIEKFKAGDENGWWKRVYNSCRARLGPVTNRARVGVYLRWNGKAQPDARTQGLFFGIDRIKGSVSIAINPKGKEKETVQEGRRFIRMGENVEEIQLPNEGTKMSLPKSLAGVYYKYSDQPSQADWWKRIDPPPVSDEDNEQIGERIIPVRGKQVLVCLEEGAVSGWRLSPGRHTTNDGAIFYVDDPFVMVWPQSRARAQRRSYPALRITVVLRPTRNVMLDIAEGVNIVLAARSPHIEAESDAPSNLELEDGGQVCAGEIALGVTDGTDDCEYCWEVDNEAIDGKSKELDLSSDRLGDCIHWLRVRCRVRNRQDGKQRFCLNKTILWLPSKIAQRLAGSNDQSPPPGWQIAPTENRIQRYEDRINNQIRYCVTDPRGHFAEILAPATNMDYWFVQGDADYDEATEMNQRKIFKSNIDMESWERWTLVVPGNGVPRGRMELKMGGIPRDVGRYKPADEANGMWRIPLGEVCSFQAGDAFQYSVERTRNAILSCNGINVAQFSKYLPEKDILCKDTEGNWGVLFSRVHDRCWVAVSTDNTGSPLFETPAVYNVEKSGDAPFTSIQRWIEKITANDSIGELVLALLPRRAGQSDFPTGITDFLEAGCQVVFFRQKANTPYNAEQFDFARLRKCRANIEWRLPSAHVFTQARLLTSPLGLPDLPTWLGIWSEFFNAQDRSPAFWSEIGKRMKSSLSGGYNFLADLRWVKKAGSCWVNWMQKNPEPDLRMRLGKWIPLPAERAFYSLSPNNGQQSLLPYTIKIEEDKCLDQILKRFGGNLLDSIRDRPEVSPEDLIGLAVGVAEWAKSLKHGLSDFVENLMNGTIKQGRNTNWNPESIILLTSLSLGICNSFRSVNDDARPVGWGSAAYATLLSLTQYWFDKVYADNMRENTGAPSWCIWKVLMEQVVKTAKLLNRLDSLSLEF
jgi:hypothetical protein